MQETPILSLGGEDVLEKEMATHSSILAWEILWNRETWSATVHGVKKESDTTEQLTLHYYKGESGFQAEENCVYFISLLF